MSDVLRINSTVARALRVSRYDISLRQWGTFPKQQVVVHGQMARLGATLHTEYCGRGRGNNDMLVARMLHAKSALSQAQKENARAFSLLASQPRKPRPLQWTL
jgi:hypothetical protein